MTTSKPAEIACPGALLARCPLGWRAFFVGGRGLVRKLFVDFIACRREVPVDVFRVQPDFDRHDTFCI